MALTFEEIVDAAREKTGGLPDPDVDSWQEGLQILVDDYARADQLTERGLQSVKGRHVDHLASRMQVDEYIRKNPAVIEAPIKDPVFILGMPRTGTTLISYLMAADPANRSLLRWEGTNTAPPAAPGALKTDPRCLAEVAKDEPTLKAVGKMAATHWEPGDGPTECVHLVAQDFRSMMLSATTTTPTYNDWILFCDMSTAFAHRKRALQVLQSTNGGRWILKMPSDSLFIRQLFRTFPDARVIWTHRDPYAATASVLNLRGGGRSFMEKTNGAEFMRQRYPMHLALHALRPLELSRERPDRFYHLYYDDMMADPFAQLRKIYRWLDFEWTEEGEAGMRAWLAENPQGRYGKHVYSLADWGLTKKDLVPYFSDYLRAHPVATSQEA
jgi:hypothetical protein